MEISAGQGEESRRMVTRWVYAKPDINQEEDEMAGLERRCCQREGERETAVCYKREVIAGHVTAAAD